MILLLLLLLSIGLCQSSTPHRLFPIPGYPLPLLHTPTITSSDSFFNQTIDHFASPTIGNFSQRYFVNTTYAKSNGLHILYLESGQGSPERVFNENYPHMIAAKSIGATVWALEHRFYGQSRPFSTLASSNLPMMTSQQAIEDITLFIQTQNNSDNSSSSPKWVLFGEGYAGALALWHRKMYPQLTVGAVASSAPIMPAMDFFGGWCNLSIILPVLAYRRDVEAIYAAFDPTCYSNIVAGIRSVRHDVQNVYGRGNLSQSLQLTPPFDQLALNYNDFQSFFDMVATYLAIPVEYNNVNVGPFGSDKAGIKQVCDIFANVSLNDTAKVTQMIVNITTELTGSFNGIWNNYTALTVYLAQESYGTDSDGTNVVARLWLWQSGCNEFAFFPTSDFGSGAFGPNIPDNYFLNLCQDVFDPFVDVDYVKRAVNNTLNSYGRSTTYTGSNALITSGSWDPWLSLQVTNASDPTTVTLCQMAGVAHAADLKPIQSSSDSNDLKTARKLIQQKVALWMGQGQETAAPSEVGAMKFNLPKPSPSPHTYTGSRFNTRYQSLRKRIQKWRRRQNESVIPSPSQQLNPDAITYGQITQPLDHFDLTNNNTWVQYFYQNDQYYNATAQRVFIMMGQEGPASIEDVEEFWMAVIWAKAFGARVFALEHRFYGPSQPTGDLSTTSLAFLTSQQYLADVALFINSVNVANNYSSPQWVIFGGSYSGNLAAWFRLKYPQLCLGAVASSAPVQAKTDFFEYFQTVQSAIRNYGPDGCWDNVHDYFSWLQQQLTTIDGRSYLSDELELCDPWDEPYIYEKDAANLLSDMTDDLAGSTQYDSETHDYIKDACEEFKQMDQSEGVGGAMAKAKKYLAKVKRAVAKRRNWMKRGRQSVAPDDDNSNSTSSSSDDNDCYDISWKGLVDFMKQLANSTDWDITAERTWVWQTCNEFGYFQSTNFGYNVFESAIPVNWYIDLCTSVFGPAFNRISIDTNVRFTNKNYGGPNHYNGTNVVFINGSEDPWHTLGVGVDAPLNTNVTSILIDGTSHCYDMYAPQRGDKQQLKAARKKVRSILNTWLNGSN